MYANLGNYVYRACQGLFRGFSGVCRCYGRVNLGVMVSYLRCITIINYTGVLINIDRAANDITNRAIITFRTTNNINNHLIRNTNELNKEPYEGIK